MPEKARVWCILTKEGLNRVMRPEDQEKLKAEFEVTFNRSDKMPDTKAIARRIADYDILMGGWGTPPLTAEVFERAKRLKMYAHLAGSVKHILSPEVVRDYLIPRQIVTFSANEAIGYNVAEAAIGLMIMIGRHWIPFINDYRQTGRWRSDVAPWNGQFLLGSTVGIIGASKVGRYVIKLLGNWDVKIVCYDPYLTPEEAKKLGVRKVSLETLFKISDYISIHTPTTPETHRMITAKHFKLMKDGATIINTARPWVLDPEALYEEAKTGRIYVGLDVTEPEPLPPDSPLRFLDNVYITPHIAGAGYYGYFKIGEHALKAMRQLVAGKKKIFGAVPYEFYDRLA